MRRPPHHKQGPEDANEIAFRVAAEAVDESSIKPEASRPAVELGRLGGLKGGKARAAKLSPEQRSEIARRAAQARWRKN